MKRDLRSVIIAGVGTNALCHSWLSQGVDFLEELFKGSPAVTQDIQTIKTGVANVEAQLPTVAEDAANAALALIPGGFGVLAQPLVDNLIELIAQKLLAKHSNPPVGAQAVAAAIQTPGTQQAATTA